MAYILLKNKQGKSPLDIALDQESPKSVEAMLMRLHHINEYNVSRAIYKRFPELFKMQIRAFDNFLEGCFFQTPQMKARKRLQLKSQDEVFLGAHSCCVIDQAFEEEYCLSGGAEKKKRNN